MMNNSSLINLPPGAHGVVHQIAAGTCATKRLYEIGINPGTEIEVVKNDVGPLILSLAGHKIAIGRGLAQKIVVNL